jgi:hypothetical protein
MKPALLVLGSWAVAAWLSVHALAQSGASEDFKYKTNPFTAKRLGLDLQRALKPEYQDSIFGEPIAVELDDLPFVRLEEVPEEPKPMPKVIISEGFDDLVNRVAHAKAIDKIRRGYFKKYILSLAEESGERELKPLPNDSDKRFWTDDMKNEQYSNYKYIVGTLVGINLAHHYLGHFKKYRTKLVSAEGKPVSINNLLTPKEWDESLRLGVRNALNAGCTIEGVLPFFECFEQMPRRPAWTAYFLPDGAKFRDTKKTLEKIQKDFFAGKGG